MTTSHAIGVDIGGTKILVAVVDRATGTISRFERRETPAGSAALKAVVSETVSEVLTELDGETPVGSIGLGIPGLVNHQGVIRYGPNVPGVLDLDLVSHLRTSTGLPVRATNDGSCAALAEHRLGAGRGVDNMLFVAQGTGIAGGLIIDGQLRRGANGFAGEPGHMLVQDGGPLCACGQTGCWEAVASGTALANMAYDIAGEDVDMAWVPEGERGRRLRGEDVAQAAERGDGQALEVFDRFAYWVARGLGSLINLLDPALVVLGGGVSMSSVHFVDIVADRVDTFVLGAGHRPRVPVVSAQFVERAGVVGAALYGAEPAEVEPAGAEPPSP